MILKFRERNVDRIETPEIEEFKEKLFLKHRIRAIENIK